MTSIFSKIISGDLPGRFVHQDDLCVAFLTIAPICPGHTLVVPRAEIDHWTDLDDATLTRLTVVAKRIGLAQKRAFGVDRVALIIAGLEVPHTHLHVLPIRSESDIDFSKADINASAEVLDDAADRLRDALALES
ncbi:Hit Diadenosine tetraphosphate (Ap4A) hydrolase and other HIT family hydrolases [Acidimicrobiia bacterium]